MKFITFEGGEGSGKSTQAKLLNQAFSNNKIASILTREPGGTEGAEKIRNLLIDDKSPKWHPITELLLVNAARYEHAKNLIEPSIEQGKIVICDRFVDSTMAYQGFGHKIGKKLPALMHNFTMQGLSPDLTFILDIDPKIGLKRVHEKDNNRFERLDIEFHERVRRGFNEIANLATERCVLIDASRNINLIHADIINFVNFKLQLKLKTAEFSEAN